MRRFIPARSFSERTQNAAVVQCGAVLTLYYCIGALTTEGEKEVHAFASLLPSVIATVSMGAMLYINGDRFSNAATNLFYKGKDLVQKGVQRINEAAGMPTVKPAPTPTRQ
jgi:hypothetical protein